MRKILPLSALSLLLAACQAEKGHIPGAEFDPTVRTRDPAILISLLVSTTTPEASRKSADVSLVELKGKTDPTRLGILEQLLYAPGHSDTMRIYAMDQLADADASRAGRALSLYLPKFEGDVLTHACDLAIRLGDDRMIDPLIRSLERGLDDNIKQRPEWHAIEQLAKPATVEETLYTRLANATDRSVRIAALDILPSVQPPADIKSRIASMQARDPWLTDLKWWVATFDTLPAGDSEITWIQFLHRPEQTALIARALERHQQLKTQADYIPAPRFIHTLAYIDAPTLTLSRDQLLAQLNSRLSQLKHINRTPEYTNSADDKQTTLDAQQQKLSRGDLFAIHLLLNAFQNSTILQDLHRQGLADLSDTTTEHGGLLSCINVQNPTLLVTSYAPLYASSNFEYVASDKLLTETANGIAQYHFHFQQIRNEERAGPGTGDLAYAARTRCNCVVITSTNTREFNIDFYTPNGAVIDLGTYTVGQ